jgi:hypothetical protein
MDYDAEKKTERVEFKAGPKMKAELERRAKQDRRPVAEWVRIRLERVLESKKPKADGSSV